MERDRAQAKVNREMKALRKAGHYMQLEKTGGLHNYATDHKPYECTPSVYGSRRDHEQKTEKEAVQKDTRIQPAKRPRAEL